MTSRPILFSAPMIRALLAGTKTQTRRAVKWPEWVKDHDDAVRGLNVGLRVGLFRDGLPTKVFGCPYGQPGDELWVRETIKRVPANSAMWDAAIYAADDAPTSLDTWTWERGVLPAIHCPRGLSRITLRVTSVRCERLQAISEADAMAEGAAHRISTGGDLAGAFDTCDTPINYRAHFRDLWESINGAGSWAANPWVWCVGFEVRR